MKKLKARLVSGTKSPQKIVRARKAPMNRTLSLTARDRKLLSQNLIYGKNITTPLPIEGIINKTMCHDVFTTLDYLPDRFADLIFTDPPYNIRKKFNGTVFNELPQQEYEEWLDSWIRKIVRLLKPNGSFYICGDWHSSGAIYAVVKKYFRIQNRIVFEREKGRGAKANWKNCTEDIWFCTLSNDYYFDVDAVKIKRRVLAPYKHTNGKPKDWENTDSGKYRITHPSNFWTDITIPFWSMPENTDHPTQKPEKLLAKIILASSRKGNMVFDPFLGSGTTSVVAKKLGRNYLGIEHDKTYCLLAEKRLAMAETDSAIQGYADGVFWERNTLQEQIKR